MQKVLFAVQVKERPRSLLVLGKTLFDHLFFNPEHEASNTEGGQSPHVGHEGRVGMCCLESALGSTAAIDILNKLLRHVEELFFIFR